MEIKIGIQESPRELTLTSDKSPDEVDTLISDALADSTGLLRLTDEKGRRYMVPAGRIAYVEIAPSDARKVGFTPASG